MVVEKACLASRGEGDGCAALPVQVVHLWLHSVPFWPARVDEVQAEVREVQSGSMRQPIAQSGSFVEVRIPAASEVR